MIKAISAIKDKFREAPVSLTMVAICIAVYLLTLAIPSLGERMAIDTPKILHGEYWRLLTAGFAHVYFIHLIANMMTLYSIGPLVERRIGSVEIAVLILVGTLLSSITWLVAGVDKPCLGASGFLCSVVTYYICSEPWSAGMLPLIGAIPGWKALLMFSAGTIVCMATGWLGFIGHSVHAAGVVVGGLWWLASRRGSVDGDPAVIAYFKALTDPKSVSCMNRLFVTAGLGVAIGFYTVGWYFIQHNTTYNLLGFMVVLVYGIRLLRLPLRLEAFTVWHAVSIVAVSVGQISCYLGDDDYMVIVIGFCTMIIHVIIVFRDNLRLPAGRRRIRTLSYT